MVEFDSSPLEPKHMAEAERPGQNIEKLLLERVMLRKELRLRSVQETLVETSQKLDVMQDKVTEYESLPGFKQFLFISHLIKLGMVQKIQTDKS